MKVHRSVLALSAGHFFIDKYSSMLGAFLPFLHRELGLTLAQAGLLGGALMVSSSLMQPLYGYLADRFQHKIFAALAPGITGVFISCLGLAPDFATLMIFLILGGVGIAAFHPQGAAITSETSHHNLGYQMSFFISGGMLGYALGPIYITSVITLVGLKNSYWAAIPGVLMSLYLLLYGPAPRKVERHTRRENFSRQLREGRKPLLILYFLVVIRSAIQMVFVAFLPLYFTLRGFSEVQGSQYLTFFLLAGGSAGFLGGILADRFGGKRVIAISMLGTLPFLLGFLWTSGFWSVLLCVAGGAFLLFTTPVNIVMAQRLVPHGSSTVSALMMGFAWGMGGLFVPLTGAFSDHFGLEYTLSALVLLCIPGFFLALAIPGRTGSGRVSLSGDFSLKEGGLSA